MGRGVNNQGVAASTVAPPRRRTDRIIFGELFRPDQIDPRITQDENVERYIEDYVGAHEEVVYREVLIPLSYLTKARLDDPSSFFNDLIEEDELAIVAQGHVQHYAAERKRIFKKYLKKLRAGKEMRPIVVEVFQFEDNEIRIIDGYHRVAASFEAGAKSIKAYILDVRVKK